MQNQALNKNAPWNYALNKKQIYIILASLCFLAYFNSINNAFVSDDIDAIVKNPLLSKPLNYWLHPPMLLNCLDYLIAGHNPVIYHLTSIIFHAIVTILVFSFLHLFFSPEASLLGAALFAVHPIHVEAVTWISGRLYIIMALFTLVSYFLYNSATDFTKRGAGEKFKFNLGRYLFSLLFFSYYIIQNLSFYFIFPFFLILSDVVFKRWRKNWVWWLPFLGVLGLRMVLAKGIILGRISFVAQEAGGSVTWSNPIFNTAYSISSHFALLLWPAKLTLYHEPPVISMFGIALELIILSCLLISLPFIFKKAREIFFGIAIFGLFLAPTYSPIMVSWLVAERYVYFPSVGLSLVAGFFYERYLGKAANPKRRAFLLALFIFIIAAYGARSVARNEDWKTPQSLWRQTVLASPDSPRAHNNMGDAYFQEGNIDGAIREFKKAVELRPGYADAYHNLANTYHKQGSLSEAVKFYEQAISFNPRLFESYFDLGIIYLNSGSFELAVEKLKKAQELRPQDPDVLTALNFAIQKQSAVSR